MSAWGVASIFLSIAAFAVLLARVVAAGGSGWKLFGRATESDLASLYIFVSARTLRVTTIVFSFAAIGVGALLHVSWVLWLPLLIAGAILPRLVVRVLRARRRARVLEQLPDVLSLWAGLLRAGHGLSQALSQVASRQGPPLRDDLGMVLRQHRVGMPIEAAIEEWRAQVDIVDLAMVSTLLRTTRELGGNLAESLSRLADVIRSRLAMEARIRALTSQGKLQGVIVGLLPVLLLIVLSFMEADAMRMLYRSATGWIVLTAIVALEATGYVLIRRIVSIEV